MKKILLLISLLPFLPGIAKAQGWSTNTDFGTGVDNFGVYLSSIMTWVTRIAGGIALLMFIYAGYLYLTSRGDTSQIEEAKNIIIGVIVGILLLFTAEILLQNVVGIRGN